jgi:outer membrane protein
MKIYHMTILCKKFVLLILCAAFTSATFAQSGSAQPFTLQQAVEFALKNHLNIKNGEIDVEIAKARINELVGVGLPQVTGNAEINKYIELQTQFIPAEFFGGEPGTYAPVQFGQDYSATAGISASQLLFDGSYLIGLKATKIYAELSKKLLTQSKIDVAANVSKAYYYVLVARERLTQLEADLERLNKLKSDTRAMLDNGFIEKIDYDRVELSYNLLESARNQTRRMADNSYNLLRFQMGMSLKSEIELTEKIQDVNLESALVSAEPVDWKSRIEYDVMQTRYVLTGLDHKRYKSLRYPSLVLFGGLSANASRDDFTIFDPGYKWYPSSLVGVSLTMPIFGGFQKSAQVKQAYLTNKKIENALFTLEQSITLEHQSAITNLQNSLDRLQTQTKNRELARDIARVSKIKYDQGVGSNLEVIDAETSLREAESNYYTSLLEAIVAKIDVDKASGKLKY